MKITIELTDEQIDAIVLQRMGVNQPVSSSKGTGKTASGLDSGELYKRREWLKSQGIEVSDRGRIAQKYLDMYDEHHGTI